MTIIFHPMLSGVKYSLSVQDSRWRMVKKLLFFEIIWNSRPLFIGVG